MEPVFELLDDLGAPVPRPAPPTRVVSLVPSITEALAATCRERLVGATDWCTEPRDLSVARVRGTKNPDCAAIVALEPDLVVANQEENRAVDVRRLRDKGIAVWVTVVESVDGAVASLARLVTEALGLPEPEWLEAASARWSIPPRPPFATALVPIWRDPWMVVGPDTYADDILRRLGVVNLLTDDSWDVTCRGIAPGRGRSERYPRLALPDLVAAAPDVIVLPDEPYPFSAEDGPEAFPGIPCALVSGRALTWYGPAMVTAADELRTAVEAALLR